MSLEVQNLTKIFGQQKAVDNLSFRVDKGQILGFLGPNGAGKSTTMKMVSCYMSPTNGTATVCGHDILQSPEKVKSHIGYLPEHNPLYLDMYVKEYLDFVASLHKLKNKSGRIADIIELTGLSKESHKIIRSLSKGYRQRVGIAQAIMHDPEILILDEPTSGLDMNQLADIRSLIIELGKEKTVILSTHIMQEVEALCDRVIIINNGQLVADDPIEKLQQRLKGEQKTSIKLAEQSITLSVFSKIEGVTEVDENGKSIVITSRNDKDIRAEIFNTVVSSGYTMLEMKQDEVNVEHIFQKLTKSVNV